MGGERPTDDAGERAADLPVVDPPAEPSVAGDAAGDLSGGALPGRPAVHGVLLAAGTSSRFGDRNKLLAEVDGEPIVRRAARTLLGAALSGVTVVVGHEAAAVRDAVADLDVRVVYAPDYAEGQSRSVRTGVRAAAATGADAVLIALGDMPDVDPASVNALVAAYAAGEGTALAAAHEGTRGNPVLFDRRFFEALTDVSGDVGGRRILRSAEGAALVETGDPGVRRDVDTRADLRRR